MAINYPTRQQFSFKCRSNAIIGIILPYHYSRSVCCAFSSVSERPSNGEIPIEADDEQIQDRRVAGQVIQSQPSVADEGSQRPVAEQSVDGEQRHGNQTYREVGDSQRKQEVVADGLQLLVDFERNHHHDVANDRHYRQHRRYRADEDYLGDGIFCLVWSINTSIVHHRRVHIVTRFHSLNPTCCLSFPAKDIIYVTI